MKTMEPIQWVLALSRRNRHRSQIEQYLALFLSGHLTSRDLDDPEVVAWRQELGVEGRPVPALFAIRADKVRMWTGSAMLWTLMRLLGLPRSWKVVSALGALSAASAGPSSPRRRLLVRQGLVGVTAALATLGGAAPGWRRPALAQDVEDEGHATLTIKEIDGSAFDRLHDKAMDDRNYGIIRDYFATDDNWEAKGRTALKSSKKGDPLRKVYAQSWKRKGADKLVNVIYGQENDGRDWARGIVWNGRDVTNDYYVQNGNLRNEDGRVSIEEPFTKCDIDIALCTGLGISVCIFVGTGAAVACGATAMAGCAAGVAIGGYCVNNIDKGAVACNNMLNDGAC